MIARARRRRRTRCSTRCTAASARTARSRACSTGSASPTPIPACAPRRWRWTRWRRRRCSPRAGLPVARGTRRRRSTSSRPPTRCRCPTWSSRSTRAPRSASRSCARATTAAPRSRAAGGSAPQALVEEYIPGRELTVGVHGRPRAGRHRDPRRRHGFYDYESKYADGGSRHMMPADDPSRRPTRRRWTSRSRRIARSAAAARAGPISATTTPQGEPGRLVLLEVNTQPGLTPTSLLPEQAAHLRHGLSRALRLDGGERRMPRVSPPAPRKLASATGPAGCKLLLRRQQAPAAPGRLGRLAGFVVVLARHRCSCTRRSPAAALATPARAARQTRRRPAGAGHRDRGPRQHAGTAAARRARRVAAATRSWASRSSGARARIETLSWVEHATVERRLPGHDRRRRWRSGARSRSGRTRASSC